MVSFPPHRHELPEFNFSESQRKEHLGFLLSVPRCEILGKEAYNSSANLKIRSQTPYYTMCVLCFYQSQTIPYSLDEECVYKDTGI